jgi:hypothetical protein
MLEFKIDSQDPCLLHTAIAYDFFFETYGLFLDAAVTAGKENNELIDEIERVLDLSFGMADMFISKVYEQKENSNDNV